MSSFRTVAIFLCVCISCSLVAAAPKAKVLLVRVVPTTARQFNFLTALKNDHEDLKLQFWRQPDRLRRHVDIWISEKSMAEFRSQLSRMGLSYQIVCDDILGKAGKPELSMNNIEDYDSVYHKPVDIISEIRRIAITYPEALTTEIIGKSGEGRDLYSVHIHKDRSGTVKPILYINCGSHSREWLSISSCAYTIRRLVFDRDYEEETKELLDNYDVVITPMLNPDGYQFTFDKSRMWRKSRSKHATENRCRGVDINRNFNYRWGGGGSSPDACEEIYCGERPFSESESLALARYLYRLRKNLVSFMDIHTYGQLWMSPWGFTEGFPRDYARQNAALKVIQHAIKEKNGAVYKIGRSSTTLYTTSGDVLDWVYGTLGIIHCYGIELRPEISKDPNFNGFKMPREEMIPTGKDLFIGLKSLAFLMINERNARH